MLCVFIVVAHAYAQEVDNVVAPAVTAPTVQKATENAAKWKGVAPEKLSDVAETGNAEGPYTLFNPTPDDKLRPMSTESPSRTDSALTVDPGYVLIETNLLS